jgi:hypothetical protein
LQKTFQTKYHAVMSPGFDFFADASRASCASTLATRGDAASHAGIVILCVALRRLPATTASLLRILHHRLPHVRLAVLERDAMLFDTRRNH